MGVPRTGNWGSSRQIHGQVGVCPGTPNVAREMERLSARQGEGTPSILDAEKETIAGGEQKKSGTPAYLIP